jgi:hypothetical protein
MTDHRDFDAEARAMRPMMVANHLERLSHDWRWLSKAKREAVLHDAGLRVFVAGLLLKPPKEGDLVWGLASYSEEDLRQLVLGGVGGDFSDTLISELEDRMRGSE